MHKNGRENQGREKMVFSVLSVLQLLGFGKQPFMCDILNRCVQE